MGPQLDGNPIVNLKETTVEEVLRQFDQDLLEDLLPEPGHRGASPEEIKHCSLHAGVIAGVLSIVPNFTKSILWASVHDSLFLADMFAPGVRTRELGGWVYEMSYLPMVYSHVLGLEQLSSESFRVYCGIRVMLPGEDGADTYHYFFWKQS